MKISLPEYMHTRLSNLHRIYNSQIIILRIPELCEYLQVRRLYMWIFRGIICGHFFENPGVRKKDAAEEVSAPVFSARDHFGV